MSPGLKNVRVSKLRAFRPPKPQASLAWQFHQRRLLTNRRVLVVWNRRRPSPASNDRRVFQNYVIARERRVLIRYQWVVMQLHAYGQEEVRSTVVYFCWEVQYFRKFRMAHCGGKERIKGDSSSVILQRTVAQGPSMYHAHMCLPNRNSIHRNGESVQNLGDRGRQEQRSPMRSNFHCELSEWKQNTE